MTGDRILLHVADAVLRLALRARPIWRAGARTEAPMLCEGYKLVVELNRPAHRVVAHDKRAWIVHQHFLRHTAEGRECALEPGEPMLLPLGPERTHMEPSRVPERRHEHECLDFRPSDLDQALPEVDLQLPTRRRLKPRRRQRLRLQRLAIGLHGALQRPPADCTEGHRLVWATRGRGFEAPSAREAATQPTVETIGSKECVIATRLWKHAK